MAVDELQAAGVERMDTAAIEAFVRSQKTGVLGLPAEQAPYLLPMSFGYDGEDRLYFSFFLGSGSRKETLAEGAQAARFLIYHADSMFTWESVLFEGTLSPVPEAEHEAIASVLADTWRPALFDADRFSGGVRVYALDVTERSGLRHTGLPPAFRRGDGDTPE